MVKVMVMTWLVLLALGIASLFWYNEWIYSLPTPLPSNYLNVNLGDSLELPDELSLPPNKPILIHFFNPDCPCSRFNIPHFKSLVKQYGNDVTFVIVPLTLMGRNFTVDEIQKKFDLSIPVLFNAQIASRYGVYSTPQAVIIDTNHRLYYRGNYNKGRYCTDKKSNYAQMALDSVLQQNTTAAFSPFALKAYGCQIPICSR